MFETIILNGNIRVTVDWTQKAKCKKCHKPIVWANSVVTGRYMPICQDKNGQWISHHADCPWAAQFRKNRQPGGGDLLAEADIQKKREKWLS
jgi:hypothetical protein